MEVVSKDKFEEAIILLKEVYTLLEKQDEFGGTDGYVDPFGTYSLMKDIDKFVQDYEDSINTMFIIEDEW